LDTLSPIQRSINMSRVKGRDTRPEKIVRSLLHRLGYRFRLHNNKLPGKPDITLAKYKTVIFVHGCFWHRHSGCPRASIPKTRQEFWTNKFEKNINRDKQVQTNLKELGWKIIVIWECELKDIPRLEKRILSEI